MPALHETPEDVARALARHAPRNLRRILDPAAGRGALLAALGPRIKSARVTAVDRSRRALGVLDLRIRGSVRVLETVCADFLTWSRERATASYDCIVMNPPFVGRRGEHILFRDRAGLRRRVPIETAFLLRSLDLLAKGGRLLAVLPSSLISGQRSSWIRSRLTELGSVRYVYELPAWTFSRVEGRTYLLVFERGASCSTIRLRNHHPLEPEELRVTPVEQGIRLDFGHHNARYALASMINTSPRLDWRRIGDVASVYRGSADSPDGAEHGIHSSDFRDGIWRRPARPLWRDSTERGVSSGDILLRRVGRGSLRTAGRAPRVSAVAASDCLLVLRPNRPRTRDRLLFAIRTALGGPLAEGLLASGMGASYVTAAGVREVMVPVKLPSLQPRLFADYVDAIERRDAMAMNGIEESARARL